ncbi:MAG: sodium:solute symporter family protein [Gammaproteobacteria bacterium]|nr:sodium:solute symporter family protein [Gammaproteobacteria bacterium]
MMAIALIALIFVFALALGLLARRGKKMDLEQWAVGRRGFGTAVIFLLMAGEIYTTFTFLGASGYAYGLGAAAFYILAYEPLAYVLGYWVLPPICRYAKLHGLITQADFFAHRFASRELGIAVGLIGVVAMIPYLALQLEGLGLIVEVASGEAIRAHVAILIGTAGLVAYVMASGIRASAWTAFMKDGLLLGIVVFLGVYLPLHAYGGIGPMFHRLAVTHPELLTLHVPQGIVWFVSTVLVSALGFWMWPHAFAYIASACSESVFRRNAAVLPLYQLLMLFILLVGFAAIGIVPGLKNPDLALLAASVAALPGWVMGVVGGAGMLAALVPGSLLLIATATLLAKNGLALTPALGTEPRIAFAARVLVVPVAIIAAAFAIFGSSGIVALLLLGYSYVVQLFPAIVLTFTVRRLVTTPGVFAGLACGVVLVTVLTLTHRHIVQLLPFLPHSLAGLNDGIAALSVNIVALVLVSAVARGRLHAADTEIA